MSAKYGTRTRSGEQVSLSGRRSTNAVSNGYFEQTFVSPGTWSNPGKVKFVDVVVVGGGGGPGTTSGGGGGRVIFEYGVPVSGPVPITVGSQGSSTWSPTTGLSRSAGGDSAFGPTAPPAPPTTIIAGGGGSVGVTVPGPPIPIPLTPTVTTAIAGQDAPPIGGGGGGGGHQLQPLPAPAPAPTPGVAGRGVFGYPGTRYIPTPVAGPILTTNIVGFGGGSGSFMGYKQFGSTVPGFITINGKGSNGFGMGGPFQDQGPRGQYQYLDGYGTPAPNPASNNTGGSGQPGRVTVMWWE